jgi:hypothetical protein
VGTCLACEVSRGSREPRARQRGTPLQSKAIDLISCALDPAPGIGARLAERAQADLGHPQVSIQDTMAASADYIAGYQDTFDRKLAFGRQDQKGSSMMYRSPTGV